MGQLIKTTNSGKAGPNYTVNCDLLFVLSCVRLEEEWFEAHDFQNIE